MPLQRFVNKELEIGANPLKSAAHYSSEIIARCRGYNNYFMTFMLLLSIINFIILTVIFDY
jgi:ABC-type transport system involved in cytochrome bd biosynthesis fused ATPase/permease subunit